MSTQNSSTEKQAGGKNAINKNSIFAVLFGILSIIAPYVGAILAILSIFFSRKALIEIKTSGEDGKIFAIVGLSGGLLTLLFYILILIFIAGKAIGS